jgi:hypothetical protein
MEESDKKYHAIVLVEISMILTLKNGWIFKVNNKSKSNESAVEKQIKI